MLGVVVYTSLLLSMASAATAAYPAVKRQGNEFPVRHSALACDRDEILEAMHSHSDSEETICHRWDWRKRALKLVKEMPAVGLFGDLHGHTKFEASSITHYKNKYVLVFDSLQELGFVSPTMRFMGEDNYLAGVSGEESQYEAITHRTRTGTLLAVKEGVEHEGKDHWHAVVNEVEVSEGDRTLKRVRRCEVDFELPEGDSRGFEGAEYVDAGDKGEFLLCVCEGNHCEGNSGRGQDAGNGRIVVTKLVEGEDGRCAWVTQKVVPLPESANFLDYSDLHVKGYTGVVRIVVSSQEDAAVWIGNIDLDRVVDKDASDEFPDCGLVLHFPRAGRDCLPQYCNVEGVHLLDGMRLLTTTDRAKRNQPWYCSAKDQSVQIFSLPDNKYLRSSGRSAEL